MKHIYYILGICILLISSCTDETEEVFKESPEVRMSGVLSEYKNILMSGDGQWLAYYGGEAILMHFYNDSVAFKSTFNNGNDDRTITYRVGASQAPELIFETHSVFHSLYELDRANREYEFLFEEISDTEITLISKTDLGADKTRIVFVKGVPSDIDDARKLKPIVDSLSYFKDFYVNDNPINYRLVTLSGKTFVKNIQEDGLIVNTPLDMGITRDGVIFVPSLEIEGESVSEFVFDETSSVFTAKNTSKKIEIRVSEDTHFSNSDVFSKFMEVDFKGLINTSYSMDSVLTYLRKDVPNFSGVQFYVIRGWTLAYAPGSEGGNWAGLSDFHYNKRDDNNFLITWDYLVWGGSFWKLFYYSRGGDILFNEFLLDPNGIYVDEVGNGEYILVSNTDPSKYIQLND
ncbi:DUF4302 domain-containing protein [Saccharicrinis aurantiacus]|uniref:DUF4302 domain-containing protein n=1 Tax=Saccharicrinis aurantiacus TaxID=1849719 RepID=UPI002490DA14|nr:DUF4302 domain-containing protein [Saccharicrinis aurantiacus]